MFNNNAVSSDFPLPLSQYSIINKQRVKIRNPITKNLEVFCYNSEAPDVFRLDNLKENKNGYKNPFLDEIIPVNRNEIFKQMEFNANQVKLIDYIKSRREYSQNPLILKYIRTDFDFEMEKKREQIKEKKEKKLNNLKYNISAGNINDRNLYEKGLKSLRTNIPKLSFKFKNQIDKNNLELIGNKYKISSFDKKTFNTISSEIEPKKTGYFSNINDYKISEGDNLNNDEMCHFKRKSSSTYNILTNERDIVHYPNIMNRKWDKYHENFFLMINKGNFKKKGGIINELNNKIISVIKPKDKYEDFRNKKNIIKSKSRNYIECKKTV
jgi:hypothetical protein